MRSFTCSDTGSRRLLRDRLSRPEYLARGWLTTGGLWPSNVILRRGWSEPRSCKLTSTGKLDCVADQFDKHLLEQRWVELTGRQCANLHFNVPVVECGIHSASSLANPYDAPFEAVTVLPVGA